MRFRSLGLAGLEPGTRVALCGILLIGALAALMMFSPIASSITQVPGIHLGVPPAPAQRAWSSSQSQFNPQFRVGALVYCADKQVALYWRYSGSGAFATVDAACNHTITTSYWPTAAECIAPDKLAVAGKDRDGRTRIELWTIKKPLVIQSAPGVIPVTTALSPQALEDVQVLYSDAAVGMDMVCGLMKRRGPGGFVFVQFYDSKSIYQLDWQHDPYPLTPVLSQSSEPLLQHAYDTFVAGDHLSLGYVYVLSVAEDLGITPWLVLKDSNRDGAIDWHGNMTSQQYQAAGLGDRAQYSEAGGLN